MSKYPSDSFLPSGALDSPRRYLTRDSMSAVPRSIPDYIPSPTSPSPNAQILSQSPQNHPMSPPKTRSASAEEQSATLIEDWRAYTQRLRSQGEGERAHMAADRARMEEVMAEERALWDKERDMLKARIIELEAELEKKGGQSHMSPAITHRQLIGYSSPGSNAVSVGGSVDGLHPRAVPQESGRNADGSPFYAPAPRNPSRTFDPSENTDLRVDDVHAPRETAICVTSKELTSSDFLKSPPSTHLAPPVPEALPESIDISHIQPELEGVSIKASAVHPVFAAQVLSPRRSPHLSPDVHPPPRDVTNMSRSPSKEEKQKMTLEVVTQPENRRLTMHAGHTPNHSISKFSFLGADGESGNATPTQNQHIQTERLRQGSIVPTEAVEEEQEVAVEDDGDQELSGTLGLTDNVPQNDVFLAQLTEKLEEVRKSADASPSNTSENSMSDSGISLKRATERDDEEKDDIPVLRLKPSINFGRPLGSI